MQEARTIQAERFVDWFASIPLTAECVFYSPQYLDKRIQKEVCDFLIILRQECILISMKSQENPSERTGERLARWAIKNAKAALLQAKGALRTLGREEIWCSHARRGRVSFAPDSINVKQILVLTEFTGEIVEFPQDMPLSVNGIPVSYLSTNDFCNLLEELRTFHDFNSYLHSKRMLPIKSLLTVGCEKLFYSYYFLNECSFDSFTGLNDTRFIVATSEALLHSSISNRQAALVEYISDSLAQRLSNYAEGLGPSTIALFDGFADRKNYLLMQEELCDLNFVGRQLLGMQFEKLIEKVRKSDSPKNMAYGAYFIDSKPDFIYVLISSKGIERPVVIERAQALLWAGMTAYNKRRGMVITDRDGKSFEVVMASDLPKNDDSQRLANEFFLNLKVFDVQASFTSSKLTNHEIPTP